MGVLVKIQAKIISISSAKRIISTFFSCQIFTILTFSKSIVKKAHKMLTNQTIFFALSKTVTPYSGDFLKWLKLKSMTTVSPIYNDMVESRGRRISWNDFYSELFTVVIDWFWRFSKMWSFLFSCTFSWWRWFIVHDLPLCWFSVIWSTTCGYTFLTGDL